MSFITDQLSRSVQRMTLETSWLPPIVINKPLDIQAGGPPNPIALFFKPRITLQGDFGDMVMEPFGAPVNNWPAVKIGLVVVAIVSLILIKRAIK